MQRYDDTPTGRVANVSIPYGDFKKHINVLLKCKWQSQWDGTVNNKLHEIYPQLGLWPGGSRIIRREESVLARIRIGHTHLTHCFLLKGEDPPQCMEGQSGQKEHFLLLINHLLILINHLLILVNIY